MTAADRPPVTPRVGDAITTAEDLYDLFADGIEYVVVATGWQPWLVTSTEDDDLVAWTWADEDTPKDKWPVRVIELLTYPVTLLAFPTVDQPRPSVTDSARAEAQSRYQGDWDPYHGEPVDDAGFSDAERRAFMAGAEWAAGRAETTTAVTSPKVASKDAETTTATTEDVADALEHWDRGIDWRLAEQENLTRAAYLRGAEQLMGLLATARTRPTRDDIARTWFASQAAIAAEEVGLDSPVTWDQLPFQDQDAMRSAADAVLALLADQPTEADAWMRAAEFVRTFFEEEGMDEVETHGVGLCTECDLLRSVASALEVQAERLRGGAS